MYVCIFIFSIVWCPKHPKLPLRKIFLKVTLRSIVSGVNSCEVNPFPTISSYGTINKLSVFLNLRFITSTMRLVMKIKQTIYVEHFKDCPKYCRQECMLTNDIVADGYPMTQAFDNREPIYKYNLKFFHNKMFFRY